MITEQTLGWAGFFDAGAASKRVPGSGIMVYLSFFGRPRRQQSRKT
jgi:hypothetical protein